ncbi:hypothetical protein GH714_038837 [Hevea brasiliensis]|uniref:aminocyclopropanecarboxylate oxidase n=1 Tax=Hevea brasiliensis TaxID=3981 RepID=A0A6A6K8I4_HEVBR|nr:hypothetical protein GH714_038837 [Hevea brasiliensis]
MEIPVIDFSEFNGENRSKMMGLLHEACEKWGFFQVENHGIDKELMEKVKQLVNSHYESNINEIPNLPQDFCKSMDEYITRLIKLAEKISELISENLGLEKDHIKDAFKGGRGPSVGTKVAKYPQCPQPELVRGLREHTDAGGIILLLQDDQVPGLEFFKDGEWVEIPPSKNNRIFINTGDQLEVLSNGRYKSALHRVMADKNGSRLSIATFYNPAGDAIISPAPKLLYPNSYSFQDYLKLYSTTKFMDKGPRFESMKKMANGHNGLYV